VVGRTHRAGQGDRYRQALCRVVEHAGVVLRLDQWGQHQRRHRQALRTRFPGAITVRDIVAVEKTLLDGLGVKHLVAVAGPSYGGYQAFQWAVSYPDFMDGIVAVVTAPKSQNVEASLAELQSRLAADPEWKGGSYYDRGGAKTALTELRVEMLKRNGIEAALAARYPDQVAREAAIR
jgi:homoserine O-acetyltransferase